ncbi:SPOSA6832_00282 [Sporobolomyces salmonicolor]|uniref:SPOSA6832_00282-mRNA-1:cds n=1 Tax=Sporidiobolus salmonicolor TaxID=5005 RepID=A0A0D6EFN7_SPOSA|nr:SPOSA6832_00282 [Sporobolomyces salmonicolor]
MAAAADNILWIDCEMTGLELKEDRILEIACIATNAQLEPLDAGIEFIVKTEKEVLEKMNDCKYTMSEIDSLVAAYVSKHFPPSTPALLAGNSVHADRAFINKDLPLLASKLHYRILDVSSIKEISRRWYPTLMGGGGYKSKDESEHRALSDIKSSIDELKFYRQHLFKPVEGCK